MKTHWLSLWNKKISVLLSLLFLVSISCNTVFAADCEDIIPDGDHPLSGYFGDPTDGPYSNGTVNTTTDAGTGLMWQSVAPDYQYTWDSACFYCDNLTVDGMSDWRMPTITDLESIADATYSPAINTEYFSVNEGLYWSASVPASFDTNAWIVSFVDGVTSISPKTGEVYVRCVRTAAVMGTLDIDLTIEITDDSKGAANTGGTADGETDLLLNPPVLIDNGGAGNHQIHFVTTGVDDVGGDPVTGKKIYRWTKDSNFTGGMTDDDKADMYIADVETGTFTFTLEVWNDEYPQYYGKKSVSVTICATDCVDEDCEFNSSPSFINDELTMILPSLFIQDTATSPKEKLEATDLEMRLVTNIPSDNRILFELVMQAPASTVDADADGYTTDGSGLGLDCDDTNPNINPGKTEILGNDIDEDCFPTALD